MNILEIKNLNIVFPGRETAVTVTDDVSLEIGRGESLCLVGESGCGKTMVALAVMSLLPDYAAVNGKIYFEGRDLLAMSGREMRKVRGRDISMIFEQPVTCLNPVLTVGEQIAEVFRYHEKVSRKDSKEKTIKLMCKVGIDMAEKRYHYYPHEFSGGMIQRMMIAMALACKPTLLVADEPTTSLDVTIQAQIIGLLKDLTKQFDTALLLITHDLGIATYLCNKVAVMYAGSIVEYGLLKEIFSTPRHPYTLSLLKAAAGQEDYLLDGYVPEFSDLPNGCRFHPRCYWKQNICREVTPQMVSGVRCHLGQGFVRLYTQ
jgi:oligopeptide/dipeptide ABC transporter ATP-binding protein